MATKLEGRIDFQFFGGRYDAGTNLLRVYPDLKTRWTYKELHNLYELIGHAELYGLKSTKGKQYLAEYLKQRGEEGSLEHCIEYNTSEYCIMLRLWRNKQVSEGQKEVRRLAKLYREEHNGDNC